MKKQRNPDGNQGDQGRMVRQKHRLVKLLLLALVLFVLLIAALLFVLSRLNIVDRFMDKAIEGTLEKALIEKPLEALIQKPPGFGKAEFKEPDPAAFAQTAAMGYIPLNQFVVLLEDGQKESLAEKLASGIDGQIVGRMEYINLFQIETAPMAEAAFMAALDTLQKTAGVEAAFANGLVTPGERTVIGTPCSPLKDELFDNVVNRRPYDMIGMREAYAIIKGSRMVLSPVQVGVLDTALYEGSLEFGGNIKTTGDRTGEPEADGLGDIVNGGFNHGTMVAHIIAADGKDAGGMTGIASLLDDKLTLNVKNLYDADLVESEDENLMELNADGSATVLKDLVYLQQQIEAGATIINCSYGPSVQGDFNKSTADAFRKFFNKAAQDHPQVLFVASAGNDNLPVNGINHFPGGIAAPNLITVGALNIDGTKAGFSNYAVDGGEVSLSAPGEMLILGVDSDGNPVRASGTSFSSPQVAATAALIRALNPQLTAAQIKDYILRNSAVATEAGQTSVTIPEGMGEGILRIDNAVLAVINDMRSENGQPALDKETLLNWSKVNLIAKGGPKKYTVTASIDALQETTTFLNIGISGMHNLEGYESQSAGIGDEVVWTVELLDPAVYVTVVREDTGGCATLYLTQGDYDGTWDTTFLVTHDTLVPVLAKAVAEQMSADIGEAIANAGCENGPSSEGDAQDATAVDADGEKTDAQWLEEEFGEDEGSSTADGSDKTDIVGMTNRMYFTIERKDPEGKSYGLKIEAQESSDSQEQGMDFSGLGEIIGTPQEDGSLLFAYSAQEEGSTFYMNYYVNLTEENLIEGSFELYIVGETEMMKLTPAESISGVLRGSRMSETP